MKYLPAFLTLAALLLAGGPLAAQEPPEMERQFLGGLRERGYTRLALEYLDRLRADPKLDPELARTLPLETARTRLALADQSPLEQRPAIYAEARAELEAFARQHEGRPEAVPARIEVARIAALQGKAQFSKALRQPTAAERVREALQARRIFEGAGKDLAGAVQMLDAQLAKYKSATKEEDQQAAAALRRERTRAEFDLGINLLLQGETYILSPDDKATDRRGELALAAAAKLAEVGKGEDNDPLRYKALTWLIPCALTGDDPAKALDRYKDVDKLKADENTFDAKMLADYFHLALIPKDPRLSKNAVANTIREGRDWLKTKNLDAFGRSPGGYGVRIPVGVYNVFVPATAADVRRAVRFEVAEATFLEAQGIAKRQPRSPRVRALYDEALKLLGPLERTESDLAPRARNLHLDIFIARHGKGGKIDDSRLATFQDFHYLARSEIQRYFRARGDKERKDTLGRIAQALTRARELADDAVPPRDLLQADTELVDVYVNLGDYHRAAVLGEELARSHAPDREAARAAGYALEAYLKVLAADEGLRRQTDERLTEDDVNRMVAADRQRFRELADFVDRQAAWHGGPVWCYARYQLALLDLRANRVSEAVALLEALPASWDGYPIARCQLAFALLRLTQKDARRDEAAAVLGFDVHYPVDVGEAEKDAYRKRALAVVQALPAATAASDPLYFRLYFAAKLEQCRLLYRDRKYVELQQLAGQLGQEFDRLKDQARGVRAAVKADLRLGLETWKNYATVGQAEEAYAKGDYDKVLAMTTPTVKRVQKQITDKVTIKDFVLVRDMLELALRADVQKGDRGGARQILDLLQRLASDPELTGGPTGIRPIEILVRLVLQLRAQVQELQKSKDPAARDQLARTQENFSKFLDELTNDLDKLTEQLDALSKQGDKKRLKLQILGLLARSYASLNQHAKAAALFTRIPEPKGENGKEPDPGEVRDYADTRLQYARELREAAHAAAPAERDPLIAKAEEVLNGPALNPKGKPNLATILLGLEVEKEKIRLLEEQGKYGTAVTRWNTLIKNGSRLRGLLADRNFEGLLAKYKDDELRRKMATPLERMYKEFVRLFWDCYYHKAYCLYKYGQKSTAPAQQQKYVGYAASHILQLEKRPDSEGWAQLKDRFEDLLGSEPLLKQRYDEMKRAAGS